MQIKIFTIPVLSGELANEELNKFLRSQKIVDIEKQVVVQKDSVYWSFCVTYLPIIQQSHAEGGGRREKVDYKQVLDEPTFTKFSLLRTIRKRLADREAVPAYAVFTDAELADIARLEVIEPSKMKKINGIGDRKVEKYGVDMCEMFANETSGISD